MKAWKCNQIDLWRGMAFSSFQRYCLLFPFASSTTNASVVKNKDWLLIVREALTRRPKQQDFILRGCFPPAILLTITVCWIIEGGPHRFSARLSFAKSYLSSFFRQSSFEVSTKSFKVCRREWGGRCRRRTVVEFLNQTMQRDYKCTWDICKPK